MLKIVYSINEISKFTENPLDQFSFWEAFPPAKDLLHVFVRTRIHKLKLTCLYEFLFLTWRKGLDMLPHIFKLRYMLFQAIMWDLHRTERK